MEDLRKELEEVRKLKEELKSEIDEIRKERYRPAREPRRHVMIEPPVIDLRGLTDSLDNMMDGLGEQVRESLRGLEHIDSRVRRRVIAGFPTSQKYRDAERVPPERVAKVIGPLGSEERLRILNSLQSGGLSFNELEQATGRTGSSLTHHLDPLVEAGYVIKGEVRGTYYLTVNGRLAYRLAQWVTSRFDRERSYGDSPEDTRKPSEDEPKDERSWWL